MTGEQDDVKDQVNYDRTDCTAESTAEDSVIAGIRKRDHQHRHQEMEKSGRDFNTFSDNHDDQSFQALKPSETLEQYQARLAQRKEQIAVKPKVDPFGIDFGDGTIETARGQTVLSTSFRHEHTTNPIETEQKVLNATENPPSSIGDSSKLSDSDIAPNISNLDQMQVATDATPDAITAWDPRQAYQNVRQYGLRTDIVRAADISAAAHPFRGREASEVNKIPAARWDEAYHLFPQLAATGIKIDSVTEVSKAIVRNELHHYDMWDRADDTAASVTGHPIPLRKNEGDATLGYSQLSPDSITKRCEEFSQLKEYLTKHGYPTGAELKALADPEMVPVLVAANLAHNAKMYARHDIPVNERTLAYGFNPDEKDSKGSKILLPDESTLNNSRHVANVMLQLELLRKGH
ncbi:MAG: hypothetical protein IPG59_20895 [Candidatus Melainabacteria bacterium]|nr:MAG: hypothetical protein IPG59_20895 [Candidatus Melainabacteria bacterium]